MYSSFSIVMCVDVSFSFFFFFLLYCERPCLSSLVRWMIVCIRYKYISSTELETIWTDWTSLIFVHFYFENFFARFFFSGWNSCKSMIEKSVVKIRFYNTLNNNNDDKTSTLLPNQKRNIREWKKKLEYKGKSCSSSKKESADIW